MLPLLARVDQGEMDIKGYSVFPKSPAILKPHYQILSCHTRTLVGRVLPLCRDAAGVLDRILSGATTPGQSGPGSDGNEGVHSPKFQIHCNLTIRLFSVISRTLFGGVFAGMQSMYSTAPSDRAYKLSVLDRKSWNRVVWESD